MKKNLIFICMLSLLILSCNSEKKQRMESIKTELSLLTPKSSELSDDLQFLTDRLIKEMDHKQRMMSLDVNYTDNDKEIKDLEIKIGQKTKDLEATTKDIEKLNNEFEKLNSQE